MNKNDLTELSVKREYGEDDSLDVRVVKQSNIVQVAAAAPRCNMRQPQPLLPPGRRALLPPKIPPSIPAL